MEVKPIKINKPILEIPINENNDKIKINLNDQIFIKNFLNMAKYGQENRPKNNENDVNKAFSYCNELSKRINLTFGEGTVKKIFETDEPTIDLLTDFIMQLEPYLQQAIEIKNKSIKNIENTYLKRQKSRGMTK